MRHMLLAVVVAAFATVAFATEASAQGNAPFCTVDNTGQQYQCYYHSLDSCRAAAGPSGSCVVNQQRNNGNRYDFGSNAGIFDDMQRARDAMRPPAPAPSNNSAALRQRWINMCGDMEQSYFNDLEDMRSRLSPALTTEEYERLSTRFRERGQYCRALAQQ